MPLKLNLFSAAKQFIGDKVEISQKILGGFPSVNESGINVTPYFVIMNTHVNGRYCGGALISDTIVMSAASCTIG